MVQKLNSEKAKADAAIVSPGNMRFGNEVNFIKAKKYNSINDQCLELGQSFYKRCFAFKPDYLFCWNSMHADQATRFQNIQRKSIKIVEVHFLINGLKTLPAKLINLRQRNWHIASMENPTSYILGHRVTLPSNQIG